MFDFELITRLYEKRGFVLIYESKPYVVDMALGLMLEVFCLESAYSLDYLLSTKTFKGLMRAQIEHFYPTFASHRSKITYLWYLYNCLRNHLL